MLLIFFSKKAISRILICGINFIVTDFSIINTIVSKNEKLKIVENGAGVIEIIKFDIICEFIMCSFINDDNDYKCYRIVISFSCTSNNCGNF